MRRFGRRASAAGMVTLALVAAGLAQAGRADAAAVSTTYTCSAAGASGPVAVSTNATAAPDPVATGATVALTVQAGNPVANGFDATIETLTLDVARPAQLAGISGVTFSGGNLAASWQTTPTGVLLTFTGPVPTGTAVLPTYTLTGTVAAGTAGQAISWAPPVVQAYLLAGDTHFYGDCTPVAGSAPIATTAVVAPVTTTTTTTTTSTTTTTRPATPKLTVGDVTVSEATSSAIFPITLDRAATSTITVSYATANGTAVAGSDYTAKTGTVTFYAGQSSKTVAVALRNDTVAEPTETFTLKVTLGSGLDPAVAHKLIGTATITDNDVATLSVVDRTLYEGSTTRAITVTVRMTASTVSQTVTWATADGTATAGSDYRAASGTLTFAPGETSKTVSVTVIGDWHLEFSEYFSVRLLAVSGGAVIGDGTGVVTLLNDDLFL